MNKRSGHVTSFTLGAEMSIAAQRPGGRAASTNADFRSRIACDRVIIYRLSINNDFVALDVLLIESCNFGSLNIATQKGLAHLKSAAMPLKVLPHPQ